jgi:hypothetical protein
MFIRSTIRLFRAAPKRLRITPTPYHDDALIDALAEALVDVWAPWIASATPRARGRMSGSHTGILSQRHYCVSCICRGFFLTLGHFSAFPKREVSHALKQADGPATRLSQVYLT